MREASANVSDRGSRTPTSESFREFLEWLDRGTDSNGESYLRIQKLLVSYFDRRNCINPEELADETLNRAARRLAEEEKIESDCPAKFCYTLARFVLLEYFRSPHARTIALDAASQSRQNGSHQPVDWEENQAQEKRLACLDQCLKRLEADQRELVLGYYRGERRTKIENRRQMAEALSISVNALSIRACRIREKLETCVKRCALK